MSESSLEGVVLTEINFLFSYREGLPESAISGGSFDSEISCAGVIRYKPQLKLHSYYLSNAHDIKKLKNMKPTIMYNYKFGNQ